MESLCQELRREQDNHRERIKELRRHFGTRSADKSERAQPAKREGLINQRCMDHKQGALNFLD